MNSNYQLFYDFTFEDVHEPYWKFEVPLGIFITAVREYFSRYGVELEGSDEEVWNSLLDIDGALDSIFASMTDWLEDKCEILALDEFKEHVYSKRGEDDEPR